MTKLIYISAISAALLFACGTLISGRTQMIQFSSNPAKAVVEINGEEIGETPVFYELDRKGTYHVAIEVEGYEPYVTIISKNLNGWAAGNILFPPGFIVDAVTGGLYQLKPVDVHAGLRKKNTESTPDVLFIDVVLNPGPGLMKIGQLRRIPE